MPTLSSTDRTSLNRLVSDPRYWDAKHPEHTDFKTKVGLAFRKAFPESSSNSDLTPSIIHVRSYTREQEGKLIQVSEYDRSQKLGFRGLALPKLSDENFIDVSNNPFHDAIVEQWADAFRRGGSKVETDMRFTTLNGQWSAEPDLFIRGPDNFLSAVEVKTGIRPALNLRQRAVYYQLGLGYQAYSTDDRIRAFGFMKREPLPPICVYGIVAQKPGDFYNIVPLTLTPNCAPDRFLEIVPPVKQE